MGAEIGHNLPAGITNLLGRDEFVDLIHGEVQRVRLVSILGPGGIGKSTVALAVAERVVDTYADGVWWIDFASYKASADVAHFIADTIGFVIQSADAGAALSRFLRKREMLLVLDNCEHVADAIAACIRQILDKASRVHLLAASRISLRVENECVHFLNGLATPTDCYGLSAEAALGFPAIELFVDRARARVDSFALTDADAAAVAIICTKLDGIPLAIELAAIKLHVFGVSGLQRQMGDGLRILGGRRAGLERHRSMAATLDWSFSLLTDPEAELLQTISVFAGGFGIEDALSAFELPVDSVIAVLGELVMNSLLSTDGEGMGSRYRMLETTRYYCLAKLAESGREPDVCRRHAKHVIRLLEKASADGGDSNTPECSALRKVLLPDLLAALVWLNSTPEDNVLRVRLTSAAAALWRAHEFTQLATSVL
ncbi:ATP-binding protein [Rhizobium sp. 'Codium 1']|uniref:ATP-binding protein n=1 Tax=Rhizobium sp. 'Codium 1' TaxID=2940484 RepID=UPI001E2D6110|nr:NB-ARC domain-containing protein [Rhizobium sp. 'Codium 1']MCC8934768.1 hypothetical protein [Rhizobium sp. 'Codium 1']